jgi:5'(3')-deoxyribonucleotidase
MKFFELANGLESRPVIYVDMDGVLADFFGPIAQHHGVKTWRDARKQRRQAGSKIDKIARKPGYFLHLKPLSNAGHLISGVLKLAGRYSILSSPLLSNVEQSSREKSEWLEHHLQNNPPRAVVFDHEKFKYARQADGTPNILIDDYDTNIHLWEANGGIGILYRNSECDRALKQLQGALHGRFRRTFKAPLAVLQKELEQTNEDQEFKERLYTNQQVLKYIKRIHDDYHLEDPVLEYKTWILKLVPTKSLSSPEKYDQDDRYRRVIDLDWDHIADITGRDIRQKPVVADAEGWVLDGNHRVAAARAANIKQIPAFVPYQE